jgi:hypothetical protein
MPGFLSSIDTTSSDPTKVLSIKGVACFWFLTLTLMFFYNAEYSCYLGHIVERH